MDPTFARARRRGPGWRILAGVVAWIGGLLTTGGAAPFRPAVALPSPAPASLFPAPAPILFAPASPPPAPVPFLPAPVPLAPAVPQGPVQNPGQPFLQASATIVYDGSSRVVLAGDPSGLVAPWVLDRLVLRVTHVDGSESGWAYDFSRGCMDPGKPIPPPDLAPALEPGQNQVSVELRDRCGTLQGSSALWLVPAAYPQILRVPQDQPTIHRAIEAAVSGALIQIAPGTYREKGLDLQGRTVTIRGAGESQTAVSGEGTAGSVFLAVSGETPATVLAHLTIREGGAGTQGSCGVSGGGLLCAAASPTLLHLTFRNHTVQAGEVCFAWGGGLACRLEAAPAVSFVTFRENVASSSGGLGLSGGGGMACLGSSPTVFRSRFLRNGGDAPGSGLYAAGGTVADGVPAHPLVLETSFQENEGSFQGGGAAAGAGGRITFERCVFAGNEATQGGGLAVSGGSATLRNCILYANRASLSGAGIVAWQVGAANPLALWNSVLTGNVCEGIGGGGLTAGSSTIMIGNSIVTANTGYGIEVLPNAASTVTLRYNDTWGNTLGDFLGGAEPGPFDIAADPLLVMPASGDMHLLPGSPAVDAGDPSILDPDGTISDLGAFGGPDGAFVLPPFATVDPPSAPVCPGGPVVLAARAAGSGPYTFQWRKDGIPVAGATGATLGIPAAAAADEGTYDVIVATGGWSQTSEAAGVFLDSLAPPEVQVSPARVHLCPGQPVAFQAQAGGAGIGYQWRKDGIPIPGATASTFGYPAVTPSDAGRFDVVVSNCAGVVTSEPATLVVGAKAPPAITAQPVGTQVCAGNAVTLRVQAKGAAPLAYQWRRDGQPIPGATQPSLMFPAVRKEDQGAYDVLVSNCGGTQGSETAEVSVSPPPSILQQPAGQTVCLGAPAAFSIAVGSPLPHTLQWRKDGQPIPGATLTTLAIPKVALADGGVYDVAITQCLEVTLSEPATLAVTNGFFTPYGSGTAGTGCTPLLVGTGCPAVGATVGLTVLGGFAGTTATVLVGAAPASIPMLGGVVLVQLPAAAVPVALAGPPGVGCGGIGAASLAIPANPQIQGSRIYLQALLPDPGAPSGVAMSGGVSITIG